MTSACIPKLKKLKKMSKAMPSHESSIFPLRAMELKLTYLKNLKNIKKKKNYLHKALEYGDCSSVKIGVTEETCSTCRKIQPTTQPLNQYKQ